MQAYGLRSRVLSQPPWPTSNLWVTSPKPPRPVSTPGQTDR